MNTFLVYNGKLPPWFCRSTGMVSGLAIGFKLTNFHDVWQWAPMYWWQALAATSAFHLVLLTRVALAARARRAGEARQ